MSEFTHFDASGASRMVDVSAKPETQRVARASGCLRMQAATLQLIQQGGHQKGNVLEVARLAGIMAAKHTGDLIPLCHSLSLHAVQIDFCFEPPERLILEAMVQSFGRTGVEMEALTAVSIAALTVYDMCKAIDRGMTIERIRLEEKEGGKSGHYLRDD